MGMERSIGFGSRNTTSSSDPLFGYETFFNKYITEEVHPLAKDVLKLSVRVCAMKAIIGVSLSGQLEDQPDLYT
jgi:hypothetical protein